MGRNKLLTKSNYLIGLQCPKYLWIKLNEEDKIPAYDAATLHKFDEGHLVDGLAKKFFPKGIDIPTEDFMVNIKKTKEFIAQGKLLFGAGILYNRIYSRLDILAPTKNDSWNIIEVKSSTKVKPEHFDDVSFQKYCCEKAGLKIGKCLLMHVNNEYIKQGEIDTNKFFSTEDITTEVDATIKGIEQRIDGMFEALDSSKCPDISISKKCDTPYECPLKECCWDFLPSGHVFELYYGGAKSFKLFEEGIYSIRDIPANVSLTDRQKIQKDCGLTGKSHISKEGIKAFLDTLSYPVYYLDFETFDPCVPIFDGTKPYQKIPFQFSLHVVQDESDKAQHYYFLADNTDDPRPKFLSSLKNVLKDNGSIVVYNQFFEKNVLKELGEAHRDYKQWTDNVSGRIKDLLDIFKSFSYYHPNQRGSASIKNVLPVLAEKSYEAMEIGDGEDASLAFLEMAYGDIADERREKIRDDLKQYCCLDTEGMLLIVKKIKELIEK
jgi:hypothetical protein